MQKLTTKNRTGNSRPGIRVDVEAHRRAREAGLCVSRIASNALLEAAEALEQRKTKEPRAGLQAQTRDTIPREGV